MQITNKDFYKRYKNFSGSFIDWFNTCVNEDDVFRFWYFDDEEDATADFVKIKGVIDIGTDYILQLQSEAWNEEEEGKETFTFTRLSNVRSFMLLANEEDYK